MSISERLKSLEGKLYMFNARQERVQKTWFDKATDTLNVQTDVQIHTASFTDAEKFLTTFKHTFVDETPVNNQLELGNMLPTISSRKVNYELKVLNTENIMSLKDILMSNIEQIRQDHGFIPKAQAINDQIKSVIDLARIEVEALKILTRKS